MKNSVKTEWLELISDSDKLYNHIQQSLSNRKQRTYKFKNGPSTPAAVLIPIFFTNNQAHLLLTKRTDKVATHKGQISFPGGSKDATDRDLQFTALRETEEEVGIRQIDVSVLGVTDHFLTITDFMITPYVGVFPYPYNFKTSEDEIDRLIEVPLAHLLCKENFRIEKMTRDGVNWNVHYYDYNGDVIWGVTGFLLSNFLTIVFNVQRGNLRTSA